LFSKLLRFTGGAVAAGGVHYFFQVIAAKKLGPSGYSEFALWGVAANAAGMLTLPLQHWLAGTRLAARSEALHARRFGVLAAALGVLGASTLLTTLGWGLGSGSSAVSFIAGGVALAGVLALYEARLDFEAIAGLTLAFPVLKWGFLALTYAFAPARLLSPVSWQAASVGGVWSAAALGLAVCAWRLREKPSLRRPEHFRWISLFPSFFVFLAGNIDLLVIESLFSGPDFERFSRVSLLPRALLMLLVPVLHFSYGVRASEGGAPLRSQELSEKNHAQSRVLELAERRAVLAGLALVPAFTVAGSLAFNWFYGESGVESWAWTALSGFAFVALFAQLQSVQGHALEGRTRRALAQTAVVAMTPLLSAGGIALAGALAGTPTVSAGESQAGAFWGALARSLEAYLLANCLGYALGAFYFKLADRKRK
jgi:hypothetical protein